MRMSHAAEYSCSIFRREVGDLCARFEPIAARSNTLDCPKLLASAAEPDMNVLILYAKLGRELFYGNAFVASSPQRGKDSGFERAASAAGVWASEAFAVLASAAASGRARRPVLFCA